VLNSIKPIREHFVSSAWNCSAAGLHVANGMNRSGAEDIKAAKGRFYVTQRSIAECVASTG
jgi:hypothetical protein